MPLFLMLIEDNTLKVKSKADQVLKSLIIYRIIIITVILGTFILIQVYIDEFLVLSPLYIVIIITYLLSIVYVLIQNRVSKRIFGLIQLLGDSVIISLVIFLTNGYDSPFVFLYSISILLAGIIFQKKGIITISILSIIMFTITCWLHLIIMRPQNISMSTAWFSVGYKSIGFIIIGFLSLYLSEALKSASWQIQQKQKSIDDLKLFNQYILQSLKSGIITTDLENRITLINNAGELILGIAHDEYLGKDIGDVFEDFYDIDSNKYRTEIEYIKDNKSIFIGIMTTKLFDSDHNIIGKLINLQDLTGIKKLEKTVQMKRKLATIGELSAVVAHEIRNPLSSIINSIELLHEDLKPEGDPKRLFEILLKESNRLNRKLNEFLEYTRLRKPNMIRTDINQTIEEVLLIFKNSIKDNAQVKYKKSLSPQYIYIDPEQIKEVLWNLLKNSLESIGNNGIISIDIQRELMKRPEGPDEEHQYLCLRVMDNGRGIDKDRLSYIFRPFLSGKKEGFGIGLAVVNSIIEMHNGWIEVDTKKDEGTTFSVYLPGEE